MLWAPMPPLAPNAVDHRSSPADVKFAVNAEPMLSLVSVPPPKSIPPRNVPTSEMLPLASSDKPYPQLCRVAPKPRDHVGTPEASNTARKTP